VAARHRVPVIDRMMDILAYLERNRDGASLSRLATGLRLPRTTVYRILNTLEVHAMLEREVGGGYRLGRRILALASAVSAAGRAVDVAAVAQPVLNRMADKLGDSVKLSVNDGLGVLVVAVAQGRRDYALSVMPGQRLPFHAGAAGKLLLAFMPPEDQNRLVAEPLSALTPKTIVDVKRLRQQCLRIRRQGWSEDVGESAPSILGFAAPVVDGQGRLLAALSVPFLAGTSDLRMRELKQAVIAGAGQVSALLAASPNFK
jgi:DNA-binding IclR family transcriptional regulator